ncbi:hypothetical protein IWQ62_000979 [Dispira parvispora]|uniref:Uncharacterized protein n=1 Tax=Dispira parvispora TaxID=1520584 RepID=A0A9W8E927_9FUNG|nr:hypothetical protein IWQ62_000979 [Dispira parvispora]
MSLVPLTTEDKRRRIAVLIAELTDPKVFCKWPESQLQHSLVELKTLARDPAGCEKVYEKQGIQMLMNHAGIGNAIRKDQRQLFPDDGVACEALTCLANMFLNYEPSRENALELRLLDRICGLANLADCSSRCHFLVARILFLLTVQRPRLIRNAVDSLGFNNRVADILNVQLANVEHSTHSSPSGPPSLFTPIQVLSEAFKAAYNATGEYRTARKISRLSPTETLFRSSSSSSVMSAKDAQEDSSPAEATQITRDEPESFIGLLRPAVATVLRLPMDMTTMSVPPPHSNAIAVLLCYSPHDFAGDFFPSSQTLALTRKLISICDHCLRLLSLNDELNPQGSSSGTGSQADSRGFILPFTTFNQNVAPSLLPLLWLLVSISRAHIPSRLEMRNHWFPENRDRSQAPETMDTPGGRMVFILAQPMPTPLSHSVGNLLYNLWNNDVSQLVNEIGYGNAAGYLYHRGITYSAENSEKHTDTTGRSSINSTSQPPSRGSRSSTLASMSVNPITGRTEDPIPMGSTNQDPSKEWNTMTEEEKEQEAEKLMVLFDRLHRTGVVEFEHPMAKAVREGKFEEE